jgi:CubicO group peptidase (beta-lactamase class C family)
MEDRTMRETQADRDRVASAMADLLADYAGDDRPGACLLVRHRGEPIFRGCFGLAELETGRPASRSAAFRLASVTKQLTAFAVLSLEAEGRLALDTSLAELLPPGPEVWRSIRVQHLLTHTSGLVDYEALMPAGRTEQILDAEVVDLLRAEPETLFPPGTSFRYSNSGYAVLAEVVARVSGLSFPSYLERELFAPLGMEGSVAHVEGDDVVAERAYGYSRAGEDGEDWERTDQSPTSAVLGDGGVYASIDDLERWLEVVEGRRELLPRYVERAMTAARLADGSDAGYGYGWFVEERDGRRWLWHTGSTIGFRNALVRLPESDLTVLLLSNRDERDEQLVSRVVARLLELVGG